MIFSIFKSHLRKEQYDTIDIMLENIPPSFKKIKIKYVKNCIKHV